MAKKKAEEATPAPITRIGETKQKVIALILKSDGQIQASFSGFANLYECLGAIDAELTPPKMKALAMQAYADKVQNNGQ